MEEVGYVTVVLTEQSHDETSLLLIITLGLHAYGMQASCQA